MLGKRYIFVPITIQFVIQKNLTRQIASLCIGELKKYSEIIESMQKQD